jgi:hypothetical protein
MRLLVPLGVLLTAAACGEAASSETPEEAPTGERPGATDEIDDSEPAGGDGDGMGGAGMGGDDEPMGPTAGPTPAMAVPDTPSSTDPSVPDAPIEPALPDPSAVDQPLRRLSHSEYANTIADLFPDFSVTIPELATEETIDGFSNHWDAMQPSELLSEQYYAVALAVARNLDAERASALAGCADTSCAASFVTDFGLRAFRRPLSDQEVGRFVELVEAGAAASDFTLGVQLAVMSFLQSPYFLYRPEFGAGPVVDERGKQLESYEAASRLSYLLWASMPDEELFARAADGSLSDPATVEAQARRMLDEPKAARSVELFFREWLKLDKLNRVLKLPEAGWDDPFRAEVVESAVRFAYREVFEKGGSVDELLTSTRYPATGATAALFGETLTEEGWGLVDANPNERAGILTHPAFLGAHGYGEYGSPVLRGVYVMDRILCAPPEPPPGNVTITLPEAPSDQAEPRTNREAYTQTTAGAECQTCHIAINGFGFAFENYDTLGQYRQEDSGFAIDATGAVGEFEFDGAVQLSAALATSDRYRDCVVQKWATYAFGGSPLAEEPRFLVDLRTELESNDGSMHELLVALAVHERYSGYLATTEVAP